MSSGLARISIACLVAFLVGACAVGAPNNVVTEGHAGAPGVERILVLPLNLAIGLPQELSGTTSPLKDAMLAHLEAQGRSVERMSFGEASQAWRAAQQETGEGGFEAAAARLVTALAAERRFDAVVMPAIVSRTMRVAHTPTRWDGVKRKLRRGSLQRGSIVGVTEISMELPVLSLLVYAFTPDGHQVFEGRGGLDIPYEVLFSDDGMRWTLNFRSDLFEDADLMAESLNVAFDPYLPSVTAR